jgi:sialic acid synthase SpsE
VEDINPGEIFSSKNIKSLRANGSLEPVFYETILNRIALSHIPKGTPIQQSHFTN